MIFIKKNFRSIKKLLALFSFFLPSFLRTRLFKLLGYKIGKNVTISPFTIIMAEEVEIGNDVYISPLVLIFNVKKLKLGNCAYVGLGAMVHSHGLGSLTIGDFGSAGMFCTINCSCNVTTGRYARIGPKSLVWSHGNALPKNHGFVNRFGPIVLGDYVWVMMGAKICPKVTVGDYVTIHPGTVVMTNIPSRSVYRYSFDSYRIQPMTPLYLKTVDDKFLDKWKGEIFDQFPSFVNDYFNENLECIAESAFWSVKFSGETIKIWDADELQKIEKPGFGQNDIVLMIKKTDTETRQKYIHLNWLDVDANYYNKPLPNDLLEYVDFYLHMKYGINFTLYECE